MLKIINFQYFWKRVSATLSLGRKAGLNLGWVPWVFYLGDKKPGYVWRRGYGLFEPPWTFIITQH